MVRMRILGVGIALSALAALASAGRLPPNAFIEQPTPTFKSFLSHVHSNARVMDKYMRHFGMTRPEVVAYFGTLHPGRLTKAALFEVFNVPGTGAIRSKNFVLKKGTEVWADYRNRPVMMKVCGNPVTRGPKTVADANDVDTGTLVEDKARDGLKAVDFGIEKEVAASEDVILTVMEPGLPIVEAVPTPEVAVASGQMPITGPMPPSIMTSAAIPAGLGAAQWLAIPALTGGILAVTTPTSKRPPGDPQPGPDDPGPNPPNDAPVPEPAGWLAIGIGTASLITLRARSARAPR